MNTRSVKILSEELVVFRDRSGAVGLLELHCPLRENIGGAADLGRERGARDNVLPPHHARQFALNTGLQDIGGGERIHYPNAG